MKKIISFLNIPRIILPTIFYLSRRGRIVINKDLERLNYMIPFKAASLGGFWYGMVWNYAFREIVYFRMRNSGKVFKLLAYLNEIILSNRCQIEISGDIDEGFAIFHGQGTIIHCHAAGKNFSVYQGVTIGRKDTGREDSRDKPIIGDNVTVFTSAVVAGGITIGDNVTIGAGAIVFKDIPSNCIVAGNPAKIIQELV